jgi:hypothetical protein
VFTDIGSWATNAISGAFDWLVTALAGPLGIVDDIIGTLAEIASKTWDTVVEITRKLIDPLTGPPGTTERVLRGGAAVDPSKIEVPSETNGRFTEAERQSAQQILAFLDGELITEETGRHRQNETASRGTFD